jgi:hypothetical protein
MDDVALLTEVAFPKNVASIIRESPRQNNTRRLSRAMFGTSSSGTLETKRVSG